MDALEEIVISGIAGRYPESDNIDEFWSKLLAGVDLVTGDDRRYPEGKGTKCILIAS